MTQPKVQRNFLPGDQWLYYKIYCGEKIANDILVEEIKDLTKDLSSRSLVDKWFFMRYHDAAPHIRLRFHLIDKKSLALVSTIINEAFQEGIDEDVIADIQMATYKRELERYTPQWMSFSESVFHIDSEYCIKALSLCESDQAMFACMLLSMRSILDLFELDDEAQKALINKMAFYYAQEFQADAKMKKSMRIKFESLKQEIDPILRFDQPKQTAIYHDLICQKSVKIKELLTSSKFLSSSDVNTKKSLISSYIHLMINRHFIANQRLIEFLLYEYLRKHDCNPEKLNLS